MKRRWGVNSINDYLEKLEKLEKEASEGPIKIEKCECADSICSSYFISLTRSDGRMSLGDCKFIAESRTAIPTLIKIVNRYREAFLAIAEKRTCEELHPGCEKYKSVHDGWEGVSQFARKALEKKVEEFEK